MDSILDFFVNIAELISSDEGFSTLRILLIISVSIIVGILAGNSAVVIFNRIPAHWLCDYNVEPSEELKQRDVQRIKSHPWKFFFSMAFVLCAIKLAVFDWQYAFAVIVSLWALLIIAISDKKYMIIPDQFVILLAISAIGYVHHHNSFLSPFFGALLGGGCMLLIGLVGKFIFKRETLGFGDVKLFGAIGLIAGPVGTATILIMCSLLSCFHFSILLIRKKIKRTDVMPLGPYIAIATAIYLVIL